MRAKSKRRTGRSPKRNKKRSKERRRGRLLAKARRILIVSLLLSIAISMLLVLPFRWVNPPVTAFMLLDDTPRTELRQQWASWNLLSESLVLAVVASEDQRFLNHSGLDFGSIHDSIRDAQAGDRLRGASTITQQVAKNIYLWRGRSFLRKGIEAYLALWFDLLLPKQRLLEIYLNVAEFGPGIYGAAAAAEAHFGKPAHEVGDTEAALLAAVLPNPVRMDAGEPSGYVRERQRWIIGQMQRLRRENTLAVLWESGP